VCGFNFLDEPYNDSTSPSNNRRCCHAQLDVNDFLGSRLISMLAIVGASLNAISPTSVRIERINEEELFVIMKFVVVENPAAEFYAREEKFTCDLGTALRSENIPSRADTECIIRSSRAVYYSGISLETFGSSLVDDRAMRRSRPKETLNRKPAG